MDLNTLYLLMRFHSLCENIGDVENCDFGAIFDKIKNSTDSAIISAVPQDIIAKAEELSESFSSEGLADLLALLLPYKEECEKHLPDLKAENEQFLALASQALCENGYFLKDGIFRKIRNNHLYIIECELTARFVADELGRVLKIEVAPYVRVADAHVKYSKTDGFLLAGVISDDDATVTDAKLYDKRAFYKTLRHLDSVEFELGEAVSITNEQLESFSKAATLGAAVCENRAIPRYYKKLIRNDIPFSKAFVLSLFSGAAFYVLLTLCLALFIGLVILAIFGYKRFWGLFEVPYYYLFTAIVSLIYSIVVFKKVRSGR